MCFCISCIESILNSKACCRLLIFWSIITTLASMVSVYYAIDVHTSQNVYKEISTLNALLGDVVRGKTVPRCKFHNFWQPQLEKARLCFTKNFFIILKQSSFLEQYTLKFVNGIFFRSVRHSQYVAAGNFSSEGKAPIRVNHRLAQLYSFTRYCQIFCSLLGWHEIVSTSETGSQS